MFARRPTRFIGRDGASLERIHCAIPHSDAPAGGKELPPDRPVTGVSEVSQPDVAEADFVRVVLQTQRQVAMRGIGRGA